MHKFWGFFVPKELIFKACCESGVAKMACYGLQRAHFTGTPSSPKVSLEKHIFDPFLSVFWSQISLGRGQGICDFGVAKMACHGLKKG